MQQVIIDQKLYKLLNPDFRICKYGVEECSPGHFFKGPFGNYFSIHYIFKGKGILKANNTEYSLSEGHGFLLSPNNPSFYQADLKDPWGYYWVSITGSKAELLLKQVNLSEGNPVFTYDRDEELKSCFMNIFSSNKYPKSLEFKLMELLYQFFFLLADNNCDNPITYKVRHVTQMKDPKEIYVTKAIEYIETNYFNKINILDVAHAVGLEPSYFGWIFKKYTNISPQDHLINYRIERACDLMMNRKYTISQVAHMVGYNEPIVFSTMFKRRKGLTPNQYRKNSIRVSIK
jgi:AraC-like DNA-binding protein